eukprot:8488750-Karenia_brevis.AAC.1
MLCESTRPSRNKSSGITAWADRQTKAGVDRTKERKSKKRKQKSRGPWGCSCCRLASCGRSGPSSDPDRLADSKGCSCCRLASCGRSGPSSDP